MSIQTTHRTHHRDGTSPLDTNTDDGRHTAGGESTVVRSGRRSTADTPARGRADGKRATHRWARRLHVYTSMVALLVVLFFGVTGITLNHPNWTFGDATTQTTTSGTLTVDATLDNGSVDWLSVAESIRSEYDVKGTVSDYSVTDTDASISFVNPGYSAELFFNTSDDSFDLTVEQQGFMAMMNDLHKGRDAGSAWSWVIDVAAGFLVLISVTGLVMQFFLRKRRRSALISAAAGAAVFLLLVWMTIS